MFRILLTVLAIFVIILLQEYKETYYHGPVSDHFNGKLFHNLEADEPKGMIDIIKWKTQTPAPTWPNSVNLPQNNLKPVNSKNPSIISINHATFLIKTGDINILTDPIWSKRASPFSFLGPRRVEAPGLAIDNLPHIDVVTITHNHYDHLDIKTIKRLEKKFKPNFVTGLGLCTAYLNKIIDKNRCIELDWWQSFVFKKSKIYFVPAKHWSKRRIFDTNKTLWGGFVFSNQYGNIYFAGDTGFGKATEFNQIKTRFKNFNLAIIPIGAYKPEWFMNSAHISPEQAVLIHKIINPKFSIAMEYDVFPMASENYGEAPKDLEAAKKKHKISKHRFITLENGSSISY